jgi:hypothetical protein
VIGLLLAEALPLLDPLELELLELLDPPHATTVAIAANASALATQLRKILISVSSAPQWVPRGSCVGSIASRHRRGRELLAPRARVR